MTAQPPTGKPGLRVGPLGLVNEQVGEPESFDHAQLLRLTRLELLSDQVATLGSADQVVAEVLGRLGIEVQVEAMQLARIPARGPLIVVCDQEFGTLEALATYQLLRRRRQDVRVLANLLLAGFAKLHDAVMAIDPGFRLASRVRNVLSLKAALRFVDEGGAVGVLPTREATTFDHEPWHVVDPTWRESIGTVIRNSGATVLPVSFAGSGDVLSGLAELLQPHGDAPAGIAPSAPGSRRAIAVEVGQPVRPSELSGLDHAEQLVSFLRARSHSLPLRASRPAARATPVTGTAGAGVTMQPVAEPGDVNELAAEVEGLPATQKLVRARGLLVGYAHGRECPRLLEELGRLRQVAFRAVGEGTPEPRDLDRFDDHYDHLFVWNDRREVVGAYRLGRIDTLPQGQLPYSGTLFEYRDGFFDRLGFAIELGRSFVRPEYQGSPVGLMMLWKGIAQYLQRHPQYRYLLGPASISARYTVASQQLMVRFIETYYGPGRWAQDVRSRRPFDPEGRREALWSRYGRFCRSVPELNRWIAHLEPDGQGVPVLVKNYLQLGARILGFSVDPDFGGCVDGLVLCDLTETRYATLKQFMGPAGAATFLAHHGVTPEE